MTVQAASPRDSESEPFQSPKLGVEPPRLGDSSPPQIGLHEGSVYNLAKTLKDPLSQIVPRACWLACTQPQRLSSVIQAGTGASSCQHLPEAAWPHISTP